jgi:hypothetical protein
LKIYGKERQLPEVWLSGITIPAFGKVTVGWGSKNVERHGRRDQAPHGRVYGRFFDPQPTGTDTSEAKRPNKGPGKTRK